MFLEPNLCLRELHMSSCIIKLRVICQVFSLWLQTAGTRIVYLSVYGFCDSVSSKAVFEAEYGLSSSFLLDCP